MEYKVFFDETCHLENDGINIMGGGAIFCEKEKFTEATRYIKYLKYKHNAFHELKWTKASKSGLAFYKALIDYFFESNFLSFRGISSDKTVLDHKTFNNGSHDKYYYKLMYLAFEPMLKEQNSYYIYTDYKDSNGAEELGSLKEFLLAKKHNNIELYFQMIRSHEAVLLQVADFFIGAIAYKKRTDLSHKSEIKNIIYDYLEEKSQKHLLHSTPREESKFNIFHHQAGYCG
ncbi:DUF3800 domain-containing protein [Halarcobacter ebronensis]|uniref:RlfA protein n=1 Tax=Halarcobacter ebronensis TaxID=1462615 RepID=A0A4V1M0I4_9BACT|nr:DUF3800 domain-containing protein [Halarcobacter ebronensis]QKF83361.1 DUF3800 domain-containing protein [Halarcobacter ebronensis]RXK05922.1 RlfA protein [Halarcobacter ebronensis]